MAFACVKYACSRMAVRGALGGDAFKRRCRIAGIDGAADMNRDAHAMLIEYRLRRGPAKVRDEFRELCT